MDKCGNGKGAIYYYDKAKRKRRTDTKRNLVENGGMNRFLDCAKKVIELKTNYRTEEGEQELHAMLDKLREGETLSEEQVQTLRRLHINNFSSNDMNTINEDATYVYANKDNCAEHNAQCLSRIVTDENPLAILKPKFSGSNSKKNLFKNEDNAKPALLCIDAKVNRMPCLCHMPQEQGGEAEVEVEVFLKVMLIDLKLNVEAEMEVFVTR